MKEKPSINEIEKLIKENRKILFLQDVYNALDISASTFYKWYPKGSNDYNDITDALDNNRTSTKQIIRDRLLDCKTPVGLIALYRLIGTPEERKALNQRDEEQNQTENQKVILKIE